MSEATVTHWPAVGATTNVMQAIYSLTQAERERVLLAAAVLYGIIDPEPRGVTGLGRDFDVALQRARAKREAVRCLAALSPEEREAVLSDLIVENGLPPCAPDSDTNVGGETTNVGGET